MATTSAAVIMLFVIIGSSLRAESFPKGCAKLVGFPERGIPGEYVVKISRGVLSHTVVNMMLEMARSGCEGKVYRTSNASDAPVKPINCSGMTYIDRFGFAAKMSDAAVMWLCDKDSVEYIEPAYPVTLPTQPSTTPPTEEIGSGGSEIVPDNIQPTTTTTDGTGTQPTVAPACSKLRGDLLPVNNYLIMFQPNLPPAKLNDLHDLLDIVKGVDKTFDIKKIRVIFQGPVKGFYYNGLSKEATVKFCESDIVDYIQVQVDSSGTPTPPQVTNTIPTTNPTPITSPVACDKIVKYDDDNGIVKDRYVLTLKRYTSHTKIIELFNQLKYLMVTGTYHSIKVKEVILIENMKMITVEMNEAGLKWICKNSYIEKIDRDKEMMITNPTTSAESSKISTMPTTQSTTELAPTPITSTPAVCDKMVKYEDKAGIVPDRYILMLKKSTSQANLLELFHQLKNLMTSEGHNSIQVKEVILTVDMKMITVEINTAGLEWICKNPYVEKIDHDKEMMINPTTSESSNNTEFECNKLRGTLPKSGVSSCKIYMTKSNNKQDCDQFVNNMKTMNEDPNSAVQFTLTSVSRHKQRPMIKAMLNADAINTVSTLFV